MNVMDIESRISALRKIAGAEKRATYGDIVNAGYGSMVMGSPFAPAPYIPGTNTLKPSDEIQREQLNSVIGGTAGLALGLGGPYALKGLKAFLWPGSFINKGVGFMARKILPKTLVDKAGPYMPLVSLLGLGARGADAAFGITSDEKGNSAAQKSMKGTLRDVMQYAQAASPGGVAAVNLYNRLLDKPLSPFIKDYVSHMPSFSKENIAKILDEMKKSDPSSFKALGMGVGSLLLSEAGDKAESAQRMLRLSKALGLAPDTLNPDEIEERMNAAQVKFNSMLGKHLENANSGVEKFIGTQLHKHPAYYNNLFNRLRKGDYAKGLRMDFFGTRAIGEGLKDSLYPDMAEYFSGDPEVQKFIKDYAPTVVSHGNMLRKNIGNAINTKHIKHDQERDVTKARPTPEVSGQ